MTSMAQSFIPPQTPNTNTTTQQQPSPPTPEAEGVEYRVTVKQKKKQTVACDACKKRRRKCTGTMPCAYCAEKGCECNYSQQHKRGKRKLSERTENIDGTVYTNALTKAHKMYRESERFETVDMFCNMRCWWKNLLDMQALKEQTTPAHYAQSCVINAWMARLAHDQTKARQYFDIARNLSINGFAGSDPVANSTAYLLMADFAPSAPEYFRYSWNAVKNLKPSSILERRIYIFSQSYQALTENDDESPNEKRVNLLSFGSDALQSSVVDLWDTTNLMVCKNHATMMAKMKTLPSVEFLREVAKLWLPKEDQNSLMIDLRATEILMQSQAQLFGFEYFTCIHYSKILLLWAGGEREKAVSEAIRYVQNMAQHGEKIIFLVEVFSLMFPLMILNEVGITQYNHQAIGIIETICKETDQPDKLAQLIPLFDQLRITASPPSYSHPISQAAPNPLPPSPPTVAIPPPSPPPFIPTFEVTLEPNLRVERNPFILESESNPTYSSDPSPSSSPFRTVNATIEDISFQAALSSSDSSYSSPGSSYPSPNSPYPPPPISDQVYTTAQQSFAFYSSSVSPPQQQSEPTALEVAYKHPLCYHSQHILPQQADLSPSTPFQVTQQSQIVDSPQLNVYEIPNWDPPAFTFIPDL